MVFVLLSKHLVFKNMSRKRRSETVPGISEKGVLGEHYTVILLTLFHFCFLFLPPLEPFSATRLGKNLPNQKNQSPTYQTQPKKPRNQKTKAPHTKTNPKHQKTQKTKPHVPKPTQKTKISNPIQKTKNPIFLEMHI